MTETNFKKLALSLLAGIVLTLALAACGDSTPAQPTAFPQPTQNPSAGVIPPSTPGPVPGTVLKFPEDEAPHNDLTDWWYYTGHLLTNDNRRYGFEFVIFQGIRTGFPVGYASHFAITDEQNNSFKYFDRISVKQNFQPGGTDGFDLKVTKKDLEDWTMRGLNGTDNLKASMDDGSFAIDLKLNDVKGIALHGGGQFSYGPGGSSYYYSRPRMSVSGTLKVGNEVKQVTGGQAWFDKQWGNFLPLAGGWDWFSTQLEDTSELMFYQLRDSTGKVIQVFGTYVPPCNGDCVPNKPIKTVDIEEKDIDLKATGSWKSLTTGIEWPSGWTVTLKPKTGLPAMVLNYQPIVKNQELDTRKSTGTIYWEGDNNITGTKDGKAIKGSGYVELTGYNLPK